MSGLREALFLFIGPFDEEDCPTFAGALDEYLGEHTAKLSDRLRTHTATDYARVLATYGPSYANGWRAGRERAAELIEGGTEA